MFLIIVDIIQFQKNGLSLCSMLSYAHARIDKDWLWFRAVPGARDISISSSVYTKAGYER